MTIQIITTSTGIGALDKLTKTLHRDIETEERKATAEITPPEHLII